MKKILKINVFITSQKNIFQTDLTDSQAIALDSFGPEADMIQVKNSTRLLKGKSELITLSF